MLNLPAQVISPHELKISRRTLPKSWQQAAGLLRRKRKALEAHVDRVRLEWR